MKEVTLPAVVTFRVDEPTRAQINLAAAAQGVAPGSFCRSVVLAAIGGVLALPRLRSELVNRDQLRELLGELGRHGSLLNQIARRLNSGGAHTAAAQDLASMRTAYEATLGRLMEVVGGGRNP